MREQRSVERDERGRRVPRLELERKVDGESAVSQRPRGEIQEGRNSQRVAPTWGTRREIRKAYWVWQLGNLWLFENAVMWNSQDSR